jgi:gliding motility-associated-like protein
LNSVSTTASDSDNASEKQPQSELKPEKSPVPVKMPATADLPLKSNESGEHHPQKGDELTSKGKEGNQKNSRESGESVESDNKSQGVLSCRQLAQFEKLIISERHYIQLLPDQRNLNSYRWEVKMNGLVSTSTESQPIFYYSDGTEQIQVMLIAKNAKGCMDTFTSQIVIPSNMVTKTSVTEKINDFEKKPLKNFFSPNGDGIADVYYYDILSETAYYRMVVKDQAGVTVFETTDNTKGWNGLLPDRTKAGAGNYYISIQYSFEADGGIKTKSQYVEISP